MDAKQLQDHLIKIKACLPALEWCEGKSLEEAWEQCTRPGWMVYILWYSYWADHEDLNIFRMYGPLAALMPEGWCSWNNQDVHPAACDLIREHYEIVDDD